MSHRKVRSCAKCGYKENGNTPDHYCAKGSINHTVTIIKEGTCTEKEIKRSTCNICGWYLDWEGSYASHTNVSETQHLTDYTEYTNELDVTFVTCTVCGLQSITYNLGQGWHEDLPYRVSLSVDVGNAYAGTPGLNETLYLDHPEWQMVSRDYVYDSEGYVKQFTLYWYDSNGTRYSYVVNCDPDYLKSWFAEYGLSYDGNVTYHLIIQGSTVKPYEISWTS